MAPIVVMFWKFFQLFALKIVDSIHSAKMGPLTLTAFIFALHPLSTALSLSLS